MARTFLTALDLQKNELQNARIQNLALAPSTPALGQIYFDTATSRFGICINTTGPVWQYHTIYTAGSGLGISGDDLSVNVDNSSIEINADILRVKASGITSAMILDGTILNADINAAAAIALSKLATDPLARANHTGTQLAATISNFDTQVRTSRIDQMAAPTAAVDLNNQKLTTVADPTNPQDGVNKRYADGLLQGVMWKAPAVIASTANVNLAASVGSIDGLSTPAGSSRVLLKDQTLPAENGIYDWNGGTGFLFRSTDADVAAELIGAAILVEKGTANADTIWQQTTDAITLGTTAIVWVKISTLTDLVAGAGLSKTGNTLDVNVDNVTMWIVSDVLYTKDAALPAAPSNGNVVVSTTGVARMHKCRLTGDGTKVNFDLPIPSNNYGSVAQVWDHTAGVVVEPTITWNQGTGNLTIGFDVAPVAAKVYNVVVLVGA